MTIRGRSATPDPEQGPGEALPPSVQAARRAHAAGRRRTARAYAPVAAPGDPAALAAELAATQALLRAESAEQVAAIVSTLVHDLGGALVSARYADPAMVLPVDVSLGQSEPLLPYADPVSVSSMRLRTVLPGFLEAALQVQSRLRAETERVEER
ncbi:MAG TPA: hypothetical protein VER39_11385 [Nocardioidaceae bacterium]|nr:hypothetical protein [Nocardioidaceae bacterium]